MFKKINNQRERLNLEYDEYRKYSLSGDPLDFDYQNQCPDYGTEDCDTDFYNQIKVKKLLNGK